MNSFYLCALNWQLSSILLGPCDASALSNPGVFPVAAQFQGKRPRMIRCLGVFVSCHLCLNFKISCLSNYRFLTSRGFKSKHHVIVRDGSKLNDKHWRKRREKAEMRRRGKAQWNIPLPNKHTHKINVNRMYPTRHQLNKQQKHDE